MNMFKDRKYFPRLQRAKQTASELSRYKILRKTNIDTHHLLCFSLTAFIVLSLLFHVDQVALAFSSDKTLENVNHLIFRSHSMLNASPALAILSEDEQLKPFSASIYDIQSHRKDLKTFSLASQIITESLSLDASTETLRKLSKNSSFKTPVQGFLNISPNKNTSLPSFRLTLPVKHFVITSRYGWRHGRPHRGMDLSAPMGTTVYSSEEGTVIMAESYYGYGNLVVVDHGNGVQTRYAHLSKMFVTEGSKVFKGQMLGNIGMTGNTTGPHLHYEVVHNNTHKNPELFLFQ